MRCKAVYLLVCIPLVLLLGGCTDEPVVPRACGPITQGTYSGSYQFSHSMNSQGTLYRRDTTYQALQHVAIPEGSESQELVVTFEGVAPGDLIGSSYTLLWNGTEQYYGSEGPQGKRLKFHSTCGDSVLYKAQQNTTNHSLWVEFKGVRQY